MWDALNLLGFTIIPEYPLSGRLRVDFFIKELRTVVEVDGAQHQEFSSFFHGDADGFKDARARDEKKQEICDRSGWHLIRLDEQFIMAATSPRDLATRIVAKINRSTVEEESVW